MTSISVKWTDEEKDQLRGLIAEGLSRAKIAKAMGRSRSSVSGQASALGLQKTIHPILTNRGQQKIDRRVTDGNLNSLSDRLRARSRVAEHTPTLAVSEIRADAVGFMDLRESHCRWVLDAKGDDGLAMYCGCRKMPGLSYCKEHSERIYADRDTWFREQREAMRRVMGSQRATA